MTLPDAFIALPPRVRPRGAGLAPPAPRAVARASAKRSSRAPIRASMPWSHRDGRRGGHRPPLSACYSVGSRTSMSLRASSGHRLWSRRGVAPAIPTYVAQAHTACGRPAALRGEARRSRPSDGQRAPGTDHRGLDHRCPPISWPRCSAQRREGAAPMISVSSAEALSRREPHGDRCSRCRDAGGKP